MSEFHFIPTVLGSDDKPVPSGAAVTLADTTGAAVQPLDLSGAATTLTAGALGGVRPFRTAERMLRGHLVYGGRRTPVVSEELWGYLEGYPLTKAAVDQAVSAAAQAAQDVAAVKFAAGSGMDLTRIKVDSTLTKTVNQDGSLTLGVSQALLGQGGGGGGFPTVANAKPLLMVRQNPDKSWPYVPVSDSYMIGLWPVAGQTTVTPPSWYDSTRCVWLSVTATSTPTTPPPASSSTTPKNLAVTRGTDASTAVVSWSADASPSGWRIDIAGTLSTGSSTWTGTLPGSARSTTIQNLVSGTTYTVKVTSATDSTNASVQYTAPASGAFTLTATASTSGIGTLTWTSATNPTAGWQYGRDGIDADGDGPWDGPLADGTRRTATLDLLVPGSTYNVWVQNLDTMAKATASVKVPTSTSGGGSTPTNPPTNPPTVGTLGKKAAELFGSNRSGLPWISGAYVGYSGWGSEQADFEAMKNGKLDAVHVYEANSDWGEVKDSINWILDLLSPAPSGLRLLYSLSILPRSNVRQWGQITSGANDAHFTNVAQKLVAAGYGNSVIRPGWELDLKNWPWSVITTADVSAYKAAYRRIVGLFRSVAGQRFRFSYEMNSDTIAPWSGDRLAFFGPSGPYPGDDVVDLIGIDIYDWGTVHFGDEAQFQERYRPDQGIGLGDVVDECRKRGKAMCFNEWGLAVPDGPNDDGAGDNPFFIERMAQFFWENRDIMGFEAYFNEPLDYIQSALTGGQNPNGALAYRAKFGQNSPYKITA